MTRQERLPFATPKERVPGGRGEPQFTSELRAGLGEDILRAPAGLREPDEM